MSDTSHVREADELDWPRLEQHLRNHLDGAIPDSAMTVRQFTKGRANLTYRVEFGEVRLVVRRPPRGELAPGSHDMNREYRVLSALWKYFARAPRALYFCQDTSVIGAPFLVEEYRDGVVVGDDIPAALADQPADAKRICRALLDAMADLHQVDVDNTDLANIGHPEGFAARQVSGWLDRWHRAAPNEATPLMGQLGSELAEDIPRPRRISLLHNDLKLDNCQFQPGEPDLVTSVFDWDMATLGDPLFDLANLLMSSASQTVWTLTNAEAIGHYRDRTSADVSNLPWYCAFARWRSGIVVQQLHNRYIKGESTDPRLASMGSLVPAIAESALAILRTGSVD
jgi:aminoglycoside phosphotransferase (APT) family kinase protein